MPLKLKIIFLTATLAFLILNACSPSLPLVQQLSGTILSSSGASPNSVIVTGTTGVSGGTATPLTVVFSTTMNGLTVNNLTLTCAGGNTNLATVSPTSNQSSYTISFSSALPQWASCTLTFPSTISSAEGVALVSTSITFRTGCETSDNFSNANTLVNCWNRTASTGTESANPVIIDDTLSMTQVTATGANLFSASNVYKSFSIFSTSSSGTTVTFQVTPDSLDLFSACYVAFASSFSATLAQNNNGVLVVSADEITWAAGYYSGGFVLQPQPSAISSYFCLQLTSAGQFKYGTASSAAACTPNNTLTNTSLSPSGGGVIVLGAYNFAGTESITCEFANLTISGSTATGPVYQY